MKKSLKKNIVKVFLNDNNIAVQFNPEGQAVEQVLYDSDNSVISKALFFYSNTRKIKEEHYDKTGMLTEIYLITYDDTKKRKAKYEISLWFAKKAPKM
ncbi:hypothetical protein QIU18_06090 [Capnocytophaga canimorsus]|nr:hypothetical protein [Capnocytophaga canimorsus]WGU71386.1 hypothetical protein QIU18_06090 [Capnocytophaga canimorsus]